MFMWSFKEITDKRVNSQPERAMRGFMEVLN